MIKETNGAAGRLGGGLPFWRGKPVMATNMTHLAPLTWRGFCLATPAPSAGSLRMPVGCPVLTQRRPLVRGGKSAGVSRVGRVRRRVSFWWGGAGNLTRASIRSGRSARRRATNRLAEPEPGRRRRGSISSRVRPDGAAALLAGGPVRARRARREVDRW
jgi:hypothetical protein